MRTISSKTIRTRAHSSTLHQHASSKRSVDGLFIHLNGNMSIHLFIDCIVYHRHEAAVKFATTTTAALLKCPRCRRASAPVCDLTIFHQKENSPQKNKTWKMNGDREKERKKKHLLFFYYLFCCYLFTWCATKTQNQIVLHPSKLAATEVEKQLLRTRTRVRSQQPHNWAQTHNIVCKKLKLREPTSCDWFRICA